MASNCSRNRRNYRPNNVTIDEAKFLDGGSVLGLSQFSILPQLPQKMMLGLKGVKIDSKISSLRR